MPQQLHAFVDRANSASSPAQLFEAFSDYTGQLGANLASYNIFVKQLRRVPFEESLIYSTFPEEWASIYKALKLWRVDPLIEGPRRYAEPATFQNMLKALKPRKKHKEYVRLLKEARLEHGIAIPIHGPYGTYAACSVAAEGRNLNLTLTQQFFLQFACLRLHTAYIGMSPKWNADAVTELSDRQGEVLTLVSRGYSNSQIAEALGVSDSTVDTTLRRTFKKLDVNNRIDAVVKAIGGGMILP